ncbi:MAG: bacteriohemerythrin [Syntrophobacteraceae bacterium]
MHSVIGSKRRTKKEWKDSFKVGICELDVQHRGLLDLINKIGDLADGHGTVESSAFGALNAMIRYADNHFRTEEGYLEKHCFPEYRQHKKEHEAFVETVFSMAQELEKENGLSLGAIIFYLDDWYGDHVLGIDQGYKQFLSSRMADEAEAVSAENSEKAAG